MLPTETFLARERPGTYRRAMPGTNDGAAVALISGAGRGLAHAVAERLVERGWRVHGMARDAKRLEKLRKLLGPECVHAGDLKDPGTASAAVQAVLAREGRLQALVHGVGTYAAAPLEETPVETVEDLIQTNWLAAVRLVDAARSALRDSGGQILFFGAAGLESLRARNDTGAYSAAKTALLVYMRSLALQEAPFGVRANMLSPGIVPHEGAAPDTLDPQLWRSIPLGRPGRVEEIADAAEWLLGAQHVTGQNLEVAGGFLL